MACVDQEEDKLNLFICEPAPYPPLVDEAEGEEKEPPRLKKGDEPSEEEVNILDLEQKPAVIIRYGGYVNWGKPNHNPSRLGPLIDTLRDRGYGIQIEHDVERMHYIEIVKEDGMSNTTVPQMMYTSLAESKMFQHNTNFRKRVEMSVEILQEMEEKLVYIKETQARTAAAAEKATRVKKFEE